MTPGATLTEATGLIGHVSAVDPPFWAAVLAVSVKQWIEHLSSSVVIHLVSSGATLAKSRGRRTLGDGRGPT